jgi:tyrosyl-tRNA synthetase
LTREQIEFNAQTYYQQASRVLDRRKQKIRYNNDWSDRSVRGMIQLAVSTTWPA